MTKYVHLNVAGKYVNEGENGTLQVVFTDLAIPHFFFSFKSIEHSFKLDMTVRTQNSV